MQNRREKETAGPGLNGTGKKGQGRDGGTGQDFTSAQCFSTVVHLPETPTSCAMACFCLTYSAA